MRARLARDLVAPRAQAGQTLPRITYWQLERDAPAKYVIPFVEI